MILGLEDYLYSESSLLESFPEIYLQRPIFNGNTASPISIKTTIKACSRVIAQ